MEDSSLRRGGRLPVILLSIVLAVVVIVASVLISSLAAENRRQIARTNSAEKQVTVEGKQASQLHQEVAALKQQAAHPTVEVWNTCGGPCRVAPQQVLVGGVPDTFVLHFAFTSSAPVTLSFLTFHQWTQFDDCDFQASCVSSSYPTYPATTKQAVDFTLGAGCAGYLYVLTAAAAATVQPDVSATYQPAPTVTGECAGSS